jgi:hypothetical protein
MIIPVGTYSQRLMQVDKDAAGEITQKDLFGVVVRRVCICLPLRQGLTLRLSVRTTHRQAKR